MVFGLISFPSRNRQTTTTVNRRVGAALGGSCSVVEVTMDDFRRNW